LPNAAIVDGRLNDRNHRWLVSLACGRKFDW
jgi:hypothetical protein